VALAASIAFGWGARNVAQDIVERAYDRPPGVCVTSILPRPSPAFSWACRVPFGT
jgi:hypothetical protein